MKNIYKPDLFYIDMQNESIIVNKMRDKFGRFHIKGNIIVKDNNTIDFSAKRKRTSAVVSDGKIKVDEYEFDDAEDAVDYVFDILKEK